MSAAALFLVVALAFKEPLVNDVFDGSEALYWVLVVAVLAYAASYFARGWLAGHQWFGLYGGLVLLESVSRCMFALAVALGIASGQTRGRARHRGGAAGVAGGRARGAQRATAPRATTSERGAMREGAGFAGAVLAIMVAEQALLNGPVLVVDATADRRRARRLRVQRPADHARAAAALPGDPDVAPPPPLRPARDRRAAPTSTARSGRRSLAIAGFAGAVVLGLGLIGPWAMGVLFGGNFDYGRVGLMLVGLGMGFHLTAGTLNQAALARRRGGVAAAAWLAAAAVFMLWLLPSPLDDEVLAVEVGYCATTALLAVALWIIDRTSAPVP